MRPARTPTVKLSCRLKPGRFLRLPPALVRRSSWRPGTVLVLRRIDRHRLLAFPLPSHGEWRVMRLRTRLHPALREQPHFALHWPDHEREFRALARGSTKGVGGRQNETD